MAEQEKKATPHIPYNKELLGDRANFKGFRGGYRPTGGRKKGSKDKRTIDKETAEAEMKMRILKSLRSLVNSQMSLAKGVQYLYRIDKKFNEKTGNYTDSKAVLVSNSEEIEAYLTRDYNQKDKYYFITSEKPDNSALNSLLDRVFGKATQAIESKEAITLKIDC